MRTRFLSASEVVFEDLVLSQEAGMRLDQWLAKHYPQRSRSHIRASLRRSRIKILRKHLAVAQLKPALRLQPGDRVQIFHSKRQEPAVVTSFRVLHEDEDCLVLEKPSPLPVHPAGKYVFHTLLAILSIERPNIEWGLVHRLDKETSGVMVLGKQAASTAAFVAQFANRKAKKKYLALVEGHAPKVWQEDVGLRRDVDGPLAIKMLPALPGEVGYLAASTSFETLAHAEKDGVLFSLVACRPITGRQHQLRVHLAHKGYPILSDSMYGAKSGTLGLERFALHAHQLTLLHPVTGLSTTFTSALPPDLASLLEGASVRLYP